MNVILMFAFRTLYPPALGWSHESAGCVMSVLYLPLRRVRCCDKMTIASTVLYPLVLPFHLCLAWFHYPAFWYIFYHIFNMITKISNKRFEKENWLHFKMSILQNYDYDSNSITDLYVDLVKIINGLTSF